MIEKENECGEPVGEYQYQISSNCYQTQKYGNDNVSKYSYKIKRRLKYGTGFV